MSKTRCFKDIRNEGTILPVYLENRIRPFENMYILRHAPIRFNRGVSIMDQTAQNTKDLTLQGGTTVTIHYALDGETLADKMAAVLSAHLSGANF